MDHNDILASLFAIVDEIMECGQDKLTGRTRVMQDLACESIDLLEIGARVAQAFHIRVDDDAMFLRSLRTKIEASGQGADAKTVIAEAHQSLNGMVDQRHTTHRHQCLRHRICQWFQSRSKPCG